MLHQIAPGHDQQPGAARAGTRAHSGRRAALENVRPMNQQGGTELSILRQDEALFDQEILAFLLVSDGL
jgi:hypothetical protein